MGTIGSLVLLFGIMATSSETSEAASGSGRALYYERVLTTEDLADRTLREMSLMRNWIYARHGHPIRTRWLREFFDARSWYVPDLPVQPADLPERDRTNAGMIARADYSIPRAVLRERRDALRGKESRSTEQEIELELLQERLGPRHASGGRLTPLQDPDQLDEALEVDQLAGFSRRDLELLRNLVHARRQRPFESELLRLWFQRFEWYEPDAEYTDERLTAIDRRNVAFIRSMEEEVGGPLSAENPDWVSAA